MFLPLFFSLLRLIFGVLLMHHRLQYVNKVPADQRPNVEFGVSVLTTASWPDSVPSTVDVPVQLCEAQALFSKFYVDQNKGRTLHWHNDLSTATVNANLRNGKRELDMTVHQCIVLLMFNEGDFYTYDTILNVTKLGRWLVHVTCDDQNACF